MMVPLLWSVNGLTVGRTQKNKRNHKDMTTPSVSAVNDSANRGGEHHPIGWNMTPAGMRQCPSTSINSIPGRVYPFRRILRNVPAAPDGLPAPGASECRSRAKI